jgi:hypothetical protein
MQDLFFPNRGFSAEMCPRAGIVFVKWDIVQ